jgi:hypothetical protein
MAGFLLAGMSLSLAACDTPVHIRGHVSDPESINAIEIGRAHV